MTLTPNLKDLTLSSFWIPLEAHLRQRVEDELLRLKVCPPEELVRIQAKIAVLEELLDLPHSLKSPKERSDHD